MSDTRMARATTRSPPANPSLVSLVTSLSITDITNSYRNSLVQLIIPRKRRGGVRGDQREGRWGRGAGGGEGRVQSPPTRRVGEAATGWSHTDNRLGKVGKPTPPVVRRTSDHPCFLGEAS